LGERYEELLVLADTSTRWKAKRRREFGQSRGLKIDWRREGLGLGATAPRNESEKKQGRVSACIKFLYEKNEGQATVKRRRKNKLEEVIVPPDRDGRAKGRVGRTRKMLRNFGNFE